MNASMTTGVAMAAAIAVTAFLPGPLPAQEGGCRQLIGKFREALQSESLQRTIDAAAPILASPNQHGCEGEHRVIVERALANAHVNEAKRQGAPERKIEVLNAGAKYTRTWQLWEALGEAQLEIKGPSGRPDFVQAMKSYQAALLAARNPSVTPIEPPRANIERLRRVIHQLQAAAPIYVSRSDELYRDATMDRGTVMTAVPFDIQFDFRMASPNARGMQAANDAQSLLREMQRPRIMIVGHTDPKGPTNPAENDRVNLALSLDRAKAVRNLLTSIGYNAQDIAVRGCGRRRPLTIERPERYTSAETDQMLRRAEICLLDRIDQDNTPSHCRRPEQPEVCP